MKKIVEFFVRQPLFGDLLTIAVIVIGLGAAFLIRREAFPNVSFDVINISTLFPGATPSEVEKLITNPIEQDIKEIDGIKKINSVSVDGLSNIFLTLDSDQTTPAKAKEDAQSIVDQISGLPDDAKKTIVKDLASKNQPIIEVSLASNKLSRLELRDLAKNLERDLENIKGVAKVSLRGVQDKEIVIKIEGKKLSQYRLSLNEVANAIKLQNSSIPAGNIESPDPQSKNTEKSLRTANDFTSIEDVGNTVVRSNESGQVIRIRDLGNIEYQLAKQSVINFTNGLPSLSLTVIKKEKGDAIRVVDKVRARVKELKASILKDVEVDFVNDVSEFVRRRLGILSGNLTLGLSLVLLLLPLMLPFRFSVLIALGEPFAFLGAMILLYMIGGSINLISMLGLIIVSGILVDDSIVVTENAVRLIEEEGMDPKEAAIKGTMQIMAPITASVLTTAFAFLPLAFMSGVFGKFVREIPIAVLACMGISLFETFFILPSHVAHWIKPKHLRKTPTKLNIFNKVTTATNNFWEQKMVPAYLQWLDFTLKKRYWVACGLLAFFVGTLILATKKMRFILFPPEGVEIFFIRTQAPVGTSLERHALLLKPIEGKLKALPKDEIKNFVTTVGIQQQDPYDPTTKRGAEYAQIAIYLTPENERSRIAKDIIDSLKQDIGTPEEFARVTFKRVNPGPPQGPPVSLGVRGESYEEIMKGANELKNILAKINGVTDISDNYILGKEELRVSVKEPEASASLLTAGQIGTTLRGAFEGLIPTSIRELDEKIDVRVTLSDGEHRTMDTLDKLLIPNQLGNLIPFSRVTMVNKMRNPSVYEHEDGLREVKVNAEVDTKITTSNLVNNHIRNLLPEIQQKFPKLKIDFGGEDEDTQESMASLGRAFMLAIVGIFLMLVLTFKKLFQPLVILITIPLGAMAVIWAFFLHGMPLSFMGMLGIVALSGVIVNNAIMLVDFVNQARDEGKDRFESILMAGKMRVRPIFLTTITTIIGVLPTAYGIGGLDKFVVPIAMALGWGLLFGSILTSFVFPAALAIIDDISGWFQKLFPNIGRAYADDDH